ncbi:hypothetical protein FB446DRAFT_655801 [Lentinula raphanica]|nr:hypothetical protein FB446DRAFT_655801 [Lentinula raphanica]
MDRAPCWRDTVEHWFLLESSFGFSKRGKGLPTASRPAAVGNWIKSYRNERTDNIPKGVGGWKGFGTELLQWWRTMNPAWRTPSPDGTFYHSTEERGDWGALDVQGANGFLSVLGCLIWWHQRAAEASMIDDRWFIMNQDLDWVLKEQLKEKGIALKKPRTD